VQNYQEFVLAATVLGQRYAGYFYDQNRQVREKWRNVCCFGLNFRGWVYVPNLDTTKRDRTYRFHLSRCPWQS